MAQSSAGRNPLLGVIRQQLVEQINASWRHIWKLLQAASFSGMIHIYLIFSRPADFLCSLHGLEEVRTKQGFTLIDAKAMKKRLAHTIS